MEALLKMMRDIARHDRSAQFARLEWALLFVEGANGDALGIIQYRAVDGTGNMIQRKLGASPFGHLRFAN